MIRQSKGATTKGAGPEKGAGTQVADAKPTSKAAATSNSGAKKAPAKGSPPPTPEAPKLDPKRRQALDSALQQIHKKCGQGSIMFLGEDRRSRIEAIPTGALSIDHVLGIGGIPRGRVTEVW